MWIYVYVHSKNLARKELKFVMGGLAHGLDFGLLKTQHQEISSLFHVPDGFSENVSIKLCDWLI